MGVTNIRIENGGIRVVKDNEYSNLVVPFEISDDKGYFLVSVVYTTGDSFNTTTGVIEHVELYDDRKQAEATAETISKHNEIHNDAHKLGTKQLAILEELYGDSHFVKLKNSAGKVYKQHAPWRGYFESVEQVVMQVVRTV
jgi:hypothetical protein